MPLFRGRNTEDAHEDPAHLLAQRDLRTQPLTQELLDWLIAALEAVLSTPQLQDVADRRPAQALNDALKKADYLYPLTLHGTREHAQAAELRAVPEVSAVHVRAASGHGLGEASGDLRAEGARSPDGDDVQG